VLVVLAAGLTGAADDEASRRLVAAVAHGDAARATLLLRQGADPDAADRSGWTGLHQAAQSGDLSLARAFLEAGTGSIPSFVDLSPLFRGASARTRGYDEDLVHPV
jgi:ankyrin repeat protein